MVCISDLTVFYQIFVFKIIYTYNLQEICCCTLLLQDSTGGKIVNLFLN
jgi:hypothetical protein